jgi:hypothetical protein
MAKLTPVKPTSIYCANGKQIVLSEASQATLKAIQKVAPHLVREETKKQNATTEPEPSESNGEANAI